MKKISLKQTNELYEFLQGKCPNNIEVKHPPKLSNKMAFTIIWFLQEHMSLIPDNYERCHKCGILFDIESEGGRKQDSPYCDYCL